MIFVVPYKPLRYVLPFLLLINRRRGFICFPFIVLGRIPFFPFPSFRKRVSNTIWKSWDSLGFEVSTKITHERISSYGCYIYFLHFLELLEDSFVDIWGVHPYISSLNFLNCFKIADTWWQIHVFVLCIKTNMLCAMSRVPYNCWSIN